MIFFILERSKDPKIPKTIECKIAHSMDRNTSNNNLVANFALSNIKHACDLGLNISTCIAQRYKVV